MSHYTGKRDSVSTNFFIDDVANRVANRVQVTTAARHPYPDALRRYSPPACIGVRFEISTSAPDRSRISTSYIERANLSVRHFNKRFARLGLGFSRKLANHRHAIALFVAAYDFCKVHSTLGTTPAHAAKISDCPWTIGRLIEAQRQFTMVNNLL